MKECTYIVKIKGSAAVESAAERLEGLMDSLYPEKLEITLVPQGYIADIVEKPICVGDRFTGGLTGRDYILALVEPYEMILINLDTGKRFADSVTVGYPCEVTSEEFYEITNGVKFTKK